MNRILSNIPCSVIAVSSDSVEFFFQISFLQKKQVYDHIALYVKQLDPKHNCNVTIQVFLQNLPSVYISSRTQRWQSPVYAAVTTTFRCSSSHQVPNQQSGDDHSLYTSNSNSTTTDNNSDVICDGNLSYISWDHSIHL